jgi:hypothetical protein
MGSWLVGPWVAPPRPFCCCARKKDVAIEGWPTWVAR